MCGEKREKVNIHYLIIPHSWHLKHQEILSAEWIEGAGATYDSKVHNTRTLNRRVHQRQAERAISQLKTI